MVEFIRILFKTRKKTFMPTVTAHLNHCAGGHRQHIKKKKWKFKLLEVKKKNCICSKYYAYLHRISRQINSRFHLDSFQFSSVTQSCPTLCDLMVARCKINIC